MRDFAALVLVGMLAAAPAMGQAGAAGQPPQSDSQVLQAILVEMRGIHNDVRLSETTQILLTELEVQHGAVDKALSRRDDLRNRVSQLQVQQKNFAAQITQLEQAASETLDQVQQKRIADQVQNMKATVTNMKSQEVNSGNDLADAESALRREQDTLSGIQGQLDVVVKKLQPAEK